VSRGGYAIPAVRCCQPNNIGGKRQGSSWPKKDPEPAEEPGEEPDELTSDTEDANDIVNFANPMHAAELNELAENESEDDAITFSNA
jgi:hypothetical protein